jgi:hypothetical protein
VHLAAHQAVSAGQPAIALAMPPRRADAAFAKAMARSEFGKYYTDEQEQREVRRSLARARSRKGAQARIGTPLTSADAQPERPEPQANGKLKLWHAPSPRHRRTELAAAATRLKAAGKSRRESETP